MAGYKSAEKWGRDTAKERYSASKISLAAEDHHAPQDPEDKHDNGYKNDASGWVRGAGETGETKPGYDKRKK